MRIIICDDNKNDMDGVAEIIIKSLKENGLQNQIIELVDKVRYSKDLKEKVFFKVWNNEEQELKFIKLRLRDIVYFDFIKSNRKIAIVLNHTVYKYVYVMERLVKELQDEGFAVNCRGQLVNLRHISKIKGYDIYLHNGQILSLSQKRVVEFKKALNDFLYSNCQSEMR